MQYLIQTGDTLSAIAQRYGTTVDAIMAANPQITNRDKIIAGKTITVPTKTGQGLSVWEAIKGLFR